MVELKQIKYNRTYRQLDEYFNSLTQKVYVGCDIIEFYDAKYRVILNISHNVKDICVNLKYLPLEIRETELLDGYLNEFTSFKSYTVSEW